MSKPSQNLNSAFSENLANLNEDELKTLAQEALECENKQIDPLSVVVDLKS